MKTKQKMAEIELAMLRLSSDAGLARVGPINSTSPAGHGFPNRQQNLNGTVPDLRLADVKDHDTLALYSPPIAVNIKNEKMQSGFHFGKNRLRRFIRLALAGSVLTSGMAAAALLNHGPGDPALTWPQ